MKIGIYNFRVPIFPTAKTELQAAATATAADDVDGAAAAAPAGDAISLTCTSSDRADIAHTPHCAECKDESRADPPDPSKSDVGSLRWLVHLQTRIGASEQANQHHTHNGEAPMP